MKKRKKVKFPKLPLVQFKRIGEPFPFLDAVMWAAVQQIGMLKDISLTKADIKRIRRYKK